MGIYFEPSLESCIALKASPAVSHLPMALLLHPLVPAFAAFESMLEDFDCCGDFSGARVCEDDRRWLLTVPLPGLTASDVTVEAVRASRHRCKIMIHALPRFEAEYRLPMYADLSAASASLVDGKLTVAVPVSAPDTVTVPVAEGDSSAEGDDTVHLNVPGFGADSLSVKADPHARTLAVSTRTWNASPPLPRTASCASICRAALPKNFPCPCRIIASTCRLQRARKSSPSFPFLATPPSRSPPSSSAAAMVTFRCTS